MTAREGKTVRTCYKKRVIAYVPARGVPQPDPIFSNLKTLLLILRVWAWLSYPPICGTEVVGRIREKCYTDPSEDLQREETSDCNE